MEQIYMALCKAHRVVQWFALGEAVRLADQIYKVCTAYQKTKRKTKVQNRLLEVAEKTERFLSGYNGSPNQDECHKELSEAIFNHKAD